MPIDKGREGGDRPPPDDWERIDTEQAARDKAQRKWDAENDPSHVWEQSARPPPEDYGKDRPTTRTVLPDQAAEMRELWGQAAVDRLIASGRLTVQDDQQSGPQDTRQSPEQGHDHPDSHSPEDQGSGDTSDAGHGRLVDDPHDRARSRADQTEGQRGNGDTNAWDNVQGEKPDRAGIHINESRQTYILDGNGRGGGGHLAGTGIPFKSEFPTTWDDDKIVREAEDVARNPDVPPELQDHDRWLLRGTRDDVEIEVVMERDGRIWTAYPDGGLGVIQNDEYGNPLTNED